MNKLAKKKQIFNTVQVVSFITDINLVACKVTGTKTAIIGVKSLLHHCDGSIVRCSLCVRVMH